MIKNNLAKLMFDRGITATQLFKDTGIARSTISKITNNNTDKISLKIIDQLCNYLRVTPAEFFDYIPYEIEVQITFDNYSDLKDIKKSYTKKPRQESEGFEVILDIRRHTDKETIFLSGNFLVDSETVPGIPVIGGIYFGLSDKNESDLSLIKSIPIQFQMDVLQLVKNEIEKKTSIPSGEMNSIGLEALGMY